MWSIWFAFDGLNDAGPLCRADKLGQLDAQLQLQCNGIATSTGTIVAQCFLTVDGNGMCVGHTKLMCRCWHFDLAFDAFAEDNLRPSTFGISIRWGFPSVPYPQHLVLETWCIAIAT